MQFIKCLPLFEPYTYEELKEDIQSAARASEFALYSDFEDYKYYSIKELKPSVLRELKTIYEEEKIRISKNRAEETERKEKLVKENQELISKLINSGLLDYKDFLPTYKRINPNDLREAT